MNIGALVSALRGNSQQQQQPQQPQQPDLLTQYRQYVLRAQEAGQQPVPQQQWAQQLRMGAGQ